MKLRAFFGGICIAAVFLPLGVRAQVSSYLTNIGTGAVDAKGVRHDGNSYRRKHPPWLDDRVKTVAPDYPYAERARHHQGAGWYRLELDLKTGIVTQVIIAKSTGFPELDQCAVSAFRQWRWRPGKWKEIYLPVEFRLGSRPPKLPPGSVRLR